MIITSKNPHIKEQCKPACHATSWSPRRQLLGILYMQKRHSLRLPLSAIKLHHLLPNTFVPTSSSFPCPPGHLQCLLLISTLHFISTLLGFSVTLRIMADQSLERYLRSFYDKKKGFATNIAKHFHLSFDHFVCFHFCNNCHPAHFKFNIHPNGTAPVLLLNTRQIEQFNSCCVEDHLYYYTKISY